MRERGLGRRRVRMAVLAAATMGVWGAPRSAQAQQAIWTGGGGDDFWSTGANWSTGLAPGLTNNVFFGGADVQPSPGVVNNIVDADRAIATLTYSNLASVGFHTTQINTGATLSVAYPGATVANVLLVGTGNSQGNTAQVQANITGAGTLAVSGTNGVIMVRQGVTGANTTGTQVAVLDMSGLARFTANVNRIVVGGEGTNDAGGANNPAGILYLANDNVITTRNTGEGITIGDASGNPSTNTSAVYLGQSNVLNVNRIRVGGRKSAGFLGFRSGLTNPTLTIRGTDGGTNRAAFLLIGDNANTGNTSFNAVGTMDLRGGAVDILVDQIFAGRGYNAATVLPGQGLAHLVWDSGTIDANTVILGQQVAAQSNASGTIAVNLGATLNVNTLLELGRKNASNANIPFGDLQVGGTVNIAGNVVDGGGFSTITLNNGLIDMMPAGDATPGNLGSALNPIDVLNLNGGTLANLGNGFVYALGGSGNITGLRGTLTVDTSSDATFTGAIGGSGGLGKSNFATLTLSGNLSYTGPTVVHMGTLVIAGTSSLTNSTNIDVRSGATLDVSAGGLNLSGGHTIGGSGQILGSVSAIPGTRIRPGDAIVPGTLTINGDLSLEGASLAFDLVDPAAANDLLIVNGDLAARGMNLVTVNPLLGSLSGGTYRLIDYARSLAAGGAANFAIAGSAAGSRRTFTFDTSTTGQVNLIVGGADPLSLVWKGDGTANRWNLNGDANWNNNTERFFNLDAVTFDDTGSTTPTVELVGDVAPGSITVNAASNYTFAGAGRITGGTGLTKDGDGKLTIANSGNNDFLGTVGINRGVLEVGNGGTSGTLGAGLVVIVNAAVLSFNRGDDLTAVNNISGSGSTIEKRGAGVLTLAGDNSNFIGAMNVLEGTLRAGSPNGLGEPNNGTITVHDGATLDMNSMTLGLKTVTVQGAGVGGAGAIVNNGPTGQNNALMNVTLAGNTSFGGAQRWDIRGGTLNAAGFNLTKVGTNRVQLVGLGETQLGDVAINEGVLGFETTTTQGDPAKTITIAPAGTLAYFNNNTNTLTKNIVSNGGRFFNDAGANVQAGNVTLNADTLFESAGGSLTVSAPIGGTGGITKNGTGDIILTGLNTYSGSTTVNAGFIRGNVDGIQGTYVINPTGANTGVVFQNSNDGSSRATFTGPGNLLAGQALAAVITLANENTYEGFSALNAGVFRVAHPRALGGTNTGTFVDGSARTGQVQLDGGIIVEGEYFGMIGRTAGNDVAHLLNFSGNNTWTGTVAAALAAESINATGVGDRYTIESAADTLTIAGNVVNDLAGAPGTSLATLRLQGAGGGVIAGGIGGTATGSWAIEKSGTGDWTLSSPANAYTGPTTINQGTLRVSGSIAGSSGVTVNSTGVFDAAATQRVKTLAVNSGGTGVVSAGVLAVGDDTLAMPLALGVAQGKLDVGGNGLVVDYAIGNDTAALQEVRSQILAGYNATPPNAGNGDWQGAGGITSSAAAAQPSSRGVGYAIAANVASDGIFMGTEVDLSSILVRHTLLGDATLDGAVNFDDLARLAQNYNNIDGARVWDEGDFTYDGNVNFDDLAKLAQNYNTSLPAPSVLPGSAQFQEDLARAFANVPEPAGLTILGVLTGGLGVRRRSRNPSVAGSLRRH